MPDGNHVAPDLPPDVEDEDQAEREYAEAEAAVECDDEWEFEAPEPGYCWRCGGSGGGPDPENSCPTCRGSGYCRGE